MKELIISTRCECQAQLEARLDAGGCVIAGDAVWPRTGRRENAPAHRTSSSRTGLDVAWLCPFCGRNTFRSFAGHQLPVIEVPTAP